MRHIEDVLPGPLEATWERDLRQQRRRLSQAEPIWRTGCLQQSQRECEVERLMSPGERGVEPLALTQHRHRRKGALGRDLDVLHRDQVADEDRCGSKRLRSLVEQIPNVATGLSNHGWASRLEDAGL